MKRIAISELEGAALDWAVAISTGLPVYDMEGNWPGNRAINEAARHRPAIIINLVRRLSIEDQDGSRAYSPTTDWSQCGPLIELFLINISYWSGLGAEDPPRFRAEMAMHIAGKGRADGETPLIAACRAIVASHNPSGYVEVPDELVEVE